MTREQSDWLYRYRFWPWLVVALVLPMKLWPASWWLDVRTVQIQNASVGDPVRMLVDRDIKRAFYGEWHATVRQWDGTGWTTWCNASGASNYSPDARYPDPLTLRWWTYPECYPLPAGRFMVTTRWKVVPSHWFLPEKEVTADSNIFEIKP